MRAKLLFVFIALLSLSSCSEYQKVLKSTDLSYKFEKAVEYYEAEKYNKAYPIFDELLTLYRGTTRAQKVYYYYAMTNFKLGDYILAAYHFKNYVKTFPNSEHAEEAAYMAGYCYYLESPTYSLDQTYTYKAINELQLFVNTHPTSDKLQQCNELISELRGKLERKAFDRAKQYFDMDYYQAAVVAFNVVLNDYPDTEYREEAMYLRLVSAYELAKNSIQEKKLQRFIESQTAYYNFMEFYPDSPKAKVANDLYAKIQEEINNLQQQS